MSLRITPIHRAGYRENLFLGADRRLMLVVAVVSSGLFFSFTTVGMISAPLFWASSVKLLRMAAKFDPQLRSVYWRYLCQAPFYPARSSPYRRRQLPGAVVKPWI
jgi:type IV secretory pathway TrbD component